MVERGQERNTHCVLVGERARWFAMIIAIANSKGSVGKSTIAVHLVAWLHSQGHKVFLADCDTQHSSSEWISHTLPEVATVFLDTPDDVLNDLPRLVRCRLCHSQ